ncbi:MAG: hypothetical protein GY754_03545, partial [bacterium]|nr:hypothetical protein [bacterium]
NLFAQKSTSESKPYWKKPYSIPKGRDITLLLNHALRKNWIPYARYLIEKGADVNSEKFYGAPPLFYSIASMNNIEFAKFLIEKGADVNYKIFSGDTFFFWYLKKLKPGNNLSFIKFMIEKGANVNVRSVEDCGITPIIWAVRKNNLPLVKYLVENGAKINVRDECGYSPLYWSASKGNLPITKYLVKKGADINIVKPDNAEYKDRDKRKACCPEFTLHYIGNYNKFSVIKFLLDKNAFDVNSKGSTGRTFLHIAASYGDPALVKYLIKKGADVNTKDNNGRTPLHVAQSNVIKYLIKKGSQINSKHKNGGSPLTDASANGDLLSVKVLLEEGADISIRDKNGDTPLNRAAFHGRLEVVKFLLKNGADINVRNKFGFTVLHMAVLHEYQWNTPGNYTSTVKYLIKKGIDINSKTTVEYKSEYYGRYDSPGIYPAGITPLKVAKISKNILAIELLKKYGAKE